MVSGVFPGSCPFLVEHLTVFIPVIGGVLFVFVVVSLLQTSLTDPGILPRATPDEAADVERQIGRTSFWRCLLGEHRWDEKGFTFSIHGQMEPTAEDNFLVLSRLLSVQRH